MPNYKKAPIKEALIDIKVELPPDVRFEDLQTLKTRLTEYPQEETRSLGQATFQFGPVVQADAQQKPWALIYRNQTNNQILQVRLDGFTFSRLEPYQDWEHLRDEAKRLWVIYRDLVHPKKIARVAVRYVNQLDIVGERVEPEEYLNTFPQIPATLPPELRDFGPFLLNLRMHQPDLKGTLVINEGNVPPKSPDTVSIVLDLDLQVENPPVETEQELWAFFEKLRERKNLYFEACITEKTRGLIN